MRSLKLFLFSTFIILLAACQNKNGENSNSNESANLADSQNKINVYYYHGERRCATCKAVGNTAKQTVDKQFSNNQDITFHDINVESVENADLVKKYELSGSGLIVCQGNTKEDLTAFAFQNAMNSPEKLKQKIIETIEKHKRANN